MAKQEAGRAAEWGEEGGNSLKREAAGREGRDLSKVFLSNLRGETWHFLQDLENRLCHSGRHSRDRKPDP